MKTSQEVAELGGVRRVTVLKWARADGHVPRHGRSYAFDDKTIKRFFARPRAGRPSV